MLLDTKLNFTIGRNILLACPLSTPLVNVNMVLFFREKAGVPLYRLFELKK